MNRTDFYPLRRARIRVRMVTALLTILRKLSECARVRAPPFEVAPRLGAMRGRIAIPKRFPRRRAGSAKFQTYVPLRTALNVPCFDGRSPTDGENSTSPEIKSAVSNFPLHINIPASRPTLPSRNSTGPEKITEFPSPRVHVPSEGFAAPQT